ncbi:capsular polysaccharide synthesis protein [Segatella copri]|uniref:capsular polysaccharide synthesis protein n=1 Tax=Segatella copri TaxID=165179 RepID=UPI003F88D9A6
MNQLYIIVRAMKQSVWQLARLPKEIRNFGFTFAIKNIWCHIILKWTDSYSAYEVLHQLIFKYLKTKYPKYLVRLQKEKLTFKDEPVKIVWVMWWQGFDTAPEIVKGCQKQLQKNCSDYKVIQLTKYNYKQYAAIPDYIVRKAENGDISLTNLSDVIRMDLLARHGGLWIDSTVLLTHRLDKAILDYPFYSIKGKMVSNNSVSKYQFCTFFMYSKQNNSYFIFIRDFLFDYWKEHNTTIHYLLIDYIMVLATMYNNDYKKMLEDIPYSNPMLHELRENFNTEYTENVWEKIMFDTYIYKLSYKYKTIEKTSSGNDTVWCHVKSLLS